MFVTKYPDVNFLYVCYLWTGDLHKDVTANFVGAVGPSLASKKIVKVHINGKSNISGTGFVDASDFSQVEKEFTLLAVAVCKFLEQGMAAWQTNVPFYLDKQLYILSCTVILPQSWKIFFGITFASRNTAARWRD